MGFPVRCLSFLRYSCMEEGEVQRTGLLVEHSRLGFLAFVKAHLASASLSRGLRANWGFAV